jgi:glutamine amidotransferase
MGWNQIAWSGHPWIQPGSNYYFVHSFYVSPRDPDMTVATSDHGGAFTAAVRSGPLLLTQFHPEKSGDTGLALLTDWVLRTDDRPFHGGTHR